jgi:hypothetical protein
VDKSLFCHHITLSITETDMGYDKNRFKTRVLAELLCPICGDVLENPRQLKNCEHNFCKDCIAVWIPYENVCYVCRDPASESDLKRVPLILQQLLNGLEIACDFASNTCGEYLRLDKLQSHVKRCPFNPGLVKVCDKNCGAYLERFCVDDEWPVHSCLEYLISLAREQKDTKQKANQMVDIMERMQAIVTGNEARIEELRLGLGLGLVAGGEEGGKGRGQGKGKEGKEKGGPEKEKEREEKKFDGELVSLRDFVEVNENN